MTPIRLGKALANGFVPNTKTTLYTVPTGKTAYISEIVALNINAASQTLIFYANPTGTSRVDGRFAGLAQYYRAQRGPGLVLEAGGTIEGETTTSNAVHYTISGVEEDTP